MHDTPLDNKENSNSTLKNKMFSLKEANEDNSIQNYTKEEKEKQNIAIKFVDTLTYKLNYTFLLKTIKPRTETKIIYENEFFCNLLLIPSYLELSDKLSTLDCLINCYKGKDNYNNIYLITNKFEKYLDTINNNQTFFYNAFSTAALSFKAQKNYFYAYKYIIKSNNLIKNSEKFSDETKEKNKENLANIKNDFIKYIKSKEDLFKDKEFDSEEKGKKIKELIDLIFSEIYNADIEKNKDNYIYAINREWLLKLKLFIEPYLTNSEEKSEYFKGAFEQNNVYNSYFNEKEERNKIITPSYSAYPGPINNYSLISFKDCWKDNINLDENDFIKKNLGRNKEYIFVNSNDWNFLVQIFDSTNEIKRKIDNLDLITIKFILFDKRIKPKNKNIDLLKQKNLQINNNSTLKQLKEKILNCVNDELKNINDVINNKNIQEVYFYILDKDKKEILIEILTALVHSIQMYESLYLEKLEFQDNETLSELFLKYNKKKHILLVEIINKNDFNFLLQMDSNYKCNSCGQNISNLNNKYNCDICHFSLFCSQICAYNSSDHKELDNAIKKYSEAKFTISELLSYSFGSIIMRGTKLGRLGLLNLGNSCYFNSVLQCLSNTIDLTKYFLKELFKKVINNGKANFFGTKGELSIQYYNLINELWNSYNNNQDYINPIKFKNIFCNKEKSFDNQDQQDAHEFLIALLNTLHQDLNRVINKKTIIFEEKKAKETDEEASNRWWEDYKKHDDSIIVDLFQGQYKSTIKCSSCHKNSIIFDKFWTLGLPIPLKKIQLQIKFFTNNYNYINLNIKVDDKTLIKDIIFKAMISLDKNKYINLAKKMDSKNDLYNYNITEVPEKALYNNIQIFELNKEHKIINIFSPNYDNIINKTDKYKKIKEIPFDNMKYIDLINKSSNSEFVLYEKDLNSNMDNYIDIYTYPITEVEREGMFLNTIKENRILSYPVIITIKKTDDLKTLHLKIFKKYQKILYHQGQSQIDSIDICYPHFNEKIGIFFTKDKICPICKKSYDRNTKFCSLFNSFDKSVLFRNLINDKNKNIPLIFYVKSFFYNPQYSIYKGMPLFYDKKFEIESKKNLNLYDSLELLNSEEILDGENMWYCNKCKGKTRAERRIQLYRTPYYLIIQLKRFKPKKNNIGKTILASKNDTNIEYKEVLNLKDFVIGPDKDNSIYDLYGVVIHKKFMNSHFYSYCKNMGIWISYDDTEINGIETPIHKDAYLLFYKKRIYE